MSALTLQSIGQGIWLPVHPDFPCTTDSFLLAHFAAKYSFSTAYDIGCGAGILSFLLLRWSERKGRVFALDIQKLALTLVQQGSIRSSLTEQILPICADYRRFQSSEKADLLLCNPPYYPPNSGKVSKKHTAATARHEMTSNLSALCQTASRLLQFGGRFCLCLPPARLPELLFEMVSAQIEPKRLQMVCKTISSPPWLCLIQGKKGGKPGLDALAPLILYHPNHRPTSALQEIYPSGSHSTA